VSYLRLGNIRVNVIVIIFSLFIYFLQFSPSGHEINVPPILSSLSADILWIVKMILSSLVVLTGIVHANKYNVNNIIGVHKILALLLIVHFILFFKVAFINGFSLKLFLNPIILYLLYLTIKHVVNSHGNSLLLAKSLSYMSVIIILTSFFTLINNDDSFFKESFFYSNKNHAAASLYSIFTATVIFRQYANLDNRYFSFFLLFSAGILIISTGSRSALLGYLVFLYIITRFKYKKFVYSIFFVCSGLVFHDIIYDKFIVGRDNRFILIFNKYFSDNVNIFFGFYGDSLKYYFEGFFPTLIYSLGLVGLPLLILFLNEFFLILRRLFSNRLFVPISNTFLAYFAGFFVINLFESVLFGVLTQSIVIFLVILTLYSTIFSSRNLITY